MATKNFKVEFKEKLVESDFDALLVALPFKNRYGQFLRDVVASDSSGEIEECLDNIKNINVGDIICLPKGNVKSKHLLGLALPSSSSDPKGNVLWIGLYSLFNYCFINQYKNVILPLLGSEAEGYSEAEANSIISSVSREFIQSHRGMHITLSYLPGESKNERKGEKYSKRPPSLLINLDEMNITSYYSYLLSYVKKRNEMGYPVLYIYDEKTFEDELNNLGFDAPQISTWKGPARKKNAKNDNDVYYPKPSKVALMRIILLLDMSYEEAIKCFFFFGYGLTPFNEIDRTWIEFLLLDEREDVFWFSKELQRKFGKENGLFPIEK
ncbi:MAG TPA: hypothetical protein DEF61_02615 [Firmicutes bacterium]|nr:hypothetical protein [Bacillota bacterium]